MISVMYATSFSQNQQGAHHLVDLNVDGIVIWMLEKQKGENERNLTSLRSFLIRGFSDHGNEIPTSMNGNILDDMNILISRNIL
jgi:hypothetical protein